MLGNCQALVEGVGVNWGIHGDPSSSALSCAVGPHGASSTLRLAPWKQFFGLSAFGGCVTSLVAVGSLDTWHCCSQKPAELPVKIQVGLFLHSRSPYTHQTANGATCPPLRVLALISSCRPSKVDWTAASGEGPGRPVLVVCLCWPCQKCITQAGATAAAEKLKANVKKAREVCECAHWEWSAARLQVREKREASEPLKCRRQTMPVVPCLHCTTSSCAST